MSLTTITVPREYGYVLSATAASFFLNIVHAINAGRFRKAAGILPPKQYAEASDVTAADNAEIKKAMYLLNCGQRAHANYLENQPSTIIAMMIAGLQNPITAASMGGFWMLARLIYMAGYTDPTKDRGQGRRTGFYLSFPLQLGLWGMAAWTGIKMVL